MPYLTPMTNPAESVRRVLLIPEDEYWQSIITGFLAHLCNPDAWEQASDDFQDVESTVARALILFDDWIAGEECPP